ncbi:hypothetical protein BJA5080_06653 [Bradyrhizobium diazoefficiens SEMIA 5080]|uniref:Uncharacterized protein n=1 Tax=Bradyrhizobium diazoefficiens SEMIA 5080 TaxID=754504 RepID=A0A837CMZ3_9BRAD|nr:hypothetical protein BJA5080_06653 [Bradyrhizobium diazoefficiens SEMIA 5080]
MFTPSARCHARAAWLQASTTATDILQLRRGSGLFRNEWILVWGPRYVDFHGNGLLHLRRKRGVVTGEPSARAFDLAAVRFTGDSALRECAERQYDKERFHPDTFPGRRSHEAFSCDGPRRAM